MREAELSQQNTLSTANGDLQLLQSLSGFSCHLLLQLVFAATLAGTAAASAGEVLISDWSSTAGVQPTGSYPPCQELPSCDRMINVVWELQVCPLKWRIFDRIVKTTPTPPHPEKKYELLYRRG
ncbi:hypothetical protein PoB_002890300 [Plakobranchus ocellatus]|uniref:Uncharacterized protein n=1 Tax=Plakobranchus ocellatus TaxID=259542 RepID=A0AAV4A6X6_9GAST|nr:hypothetical protein PoB_002890300 [Plakobranchus ocellatus]